jgi:hypothetical protein
MEFLQTEENLFYHIHTGPDSRASQTKTIAIKRRIGNLDLRYDDGLINILVY